MSPQKAKSFLFLKFVEIFPVEKLLERNTRPLAKALDGDDLGAFRATFIKIVNGGRIRKNLLTFALVRVIITA